ncbi:hypothetical protein G4Y79_22425 [Phototrophicus methaneseepsis]|uniref:Uncharacterized protein n=1 Tax=Phototrophicus methaneseepsis TaxID=2710758 RepID=A0A7S8IF06_9CHLR|nr:hypothetical protein [Phototrophicus methaneseepsis]QPC82408.1 hypothetical protein G4Y79_22425 [Phototrophicus methaneseepsis]
MSQNKPKRNLLNALHVIERYHRRRMVFTIHFILSLAIQFTVWANWFTSYAVQGTGFYSTFFSDRITVSVVLTLFLLGHLVVMRLLEAKDRDIMSAIQQYGADEEIIENYYGRLSDNDALNDHDLLSDDTEETAYQVRNQNHQQKIR